MTTEQIMQDIVFAFSGAGLKFLYDWRAWPMNPYFKSLSAMPELRIYIDTPEGFYTAEGMLCFGSQMMGASFSTQAAIDTLCEKYKVQLGPNQMKDHHYRIYTIQAKDGGDVSMM